MQRLGASTGAEAQYKRTKRIHWYTGMNRYVLSGDLLAGRVTDTWKADYSVETKLAYYHLDHLNSTKCVTDEAGVVEVMYEYRAFGEQFMRLDAEGKEMGDSAKYSYGGKELDEATNLYYFNARYYDATIGRFINVDPIQDGTNWYVYCHNNPLAMVDPTGLDDLLPSNRTRRLGVIGLLDALFSQRGFNGLDGLIAKTTTNWNVDKTQIFEISETIQNLKNVYRNASTTASRIGVVQGVIGLSNIAFGGMSLFVGAMGQCVSENYCKIGNYYETEYEKITAFIGNSSNAASYTLKAEQFESLTTCWKTNPRWTLTSYDADGNTINSVSFLYFYHPSGNPDIVDDFILNKAFSKMMVNQNGFTVINMNLSFNDVDMPTNQKIDPNTKAYLDTIGAQYGQ